jgi:O-antigen/teichoic acid export membrane protein
MRAAAVLGLGGLAFTLGNLIFARTLPPQEYGVVSLFIGIVAVAGLAAPLGLDLVMGRRGLVLDPRWRRAIAGTTLIIGLATVVVSGIVYRLEPAILACILLTTVAAGLIQASAAHFQGQQRFGPATWIVQLSNWTLLVAAAFAGVLGLDTAVRSCELLALTTTVGAVVAWIIARTTRIDQPSPGALRKEGLSLVSIHVSNSIFLQLERLLLGPIAGVQALALFGVVAALVASPFRMLQMAVLFTLTPSLRQADGVDERRRLLRREMLLVAGVIGIGSVIAWYVAPPLAHWILAGRYDLSPGLMCATLVSGALKLCSAFATGTVIALSEEKGLRALGVVSWMTIALSVVASLLAAPWGLIGVLYGVSAGWLVRSVIAGFMAGACLTDDHRSEGDRSRRASVRQAPGPM